MSAANPLNNQEFMEEEEQIKNLKMQILMYQQDESLKKAVEELEEYKQNILAATTVASNDDGEDMEQDKEEGYSGEEEKEQLSPERLVPASSIEEYEEIAAEVDDEDLDPPSDDDEQEQYLSVDKDVYIKMANDKIRKLEREIHSLRSNARDDDRYIKELEEDVAFLRSPQRRIQFLESQVENGRHQYANLSAEFRRREESMREKTEAFESLKAKMLQQVFQWQNIQRELNAKLETKDKEIQQLRQALANRETIAAASQNHEIASSPSTSQPATTSQPLQSPPITYQPSTSPSNTETTITDASMDSTNPKTPESIVVGILKSTKSNESSPDLCF